MPQPDPINNTLCELFHRAVGADKRDLLNFKRAGAWQSLSAHELAERARAVTMGLYALNVRPGDHVALLSENRPEWTMADLGILDCGAASVPIYATQAPKQVAYILNDAGVEVLFISTQAQYDRLREVLPQCRKLRAIVSFDQLSGVSGRVLGFDEFLNWGRAAAQAEPQLYDTLRADVTADTLATLIYTSGTTGEPKGVMLTHGNLLANVRATTEISQVAEHDPVLTFLPFAHIFERAVIYYYLARRATIYYAESVDAVAQNLAEVRPYFMTSVPRFFEKVYARAMEKAEAGGRVKAAIARWAVEIAEQWAELQSAGKPVDGWLAFKHKLAVKLVFVKWQTALGGRIRFFLSGGAPLPLELARVFYGAGLPILQGYGLTESSPGITACTTDANRLGSVGKAMPGVTLRIAADGEILCAGPNVMQGYYNRPEETDEALETDDEGRVWLHTGDIGRLDADGFLFITDRKKELLKTSGGKYIAPQPIENAIKRSRFVNQVVVIGDERKFPAALIVPQTDALKSYAAHKSIAYRDEAELLADPRIIDLFARQVDKYTSEFAQFERVKAVALLDRELTVEGGELTPTLKVKRRVVTEKYRALIDRLYGVTQGKNL